VNAQHRGKQRQGLALRRLDVRHGPTATAQEAGWTSSRRTPRRSPPHQRDDRQEVDYRPVESDGAARAAALIAPLLDERNEQALGTGAPRAFPRERQADSVTPASNS
jgi:hypothetical protein